MGLYFLDTQLIYICINIYQRISFMLQYFKIKVFLFIFFFLLLFVGMGPPASPTQRAPRIRAPVDRLHKRLNPPWPRPGQYPGNSRSHDKN